MSLKGPLRHGMSLWIMFKSSLALGCYSKLSGSVSVLELNCQTAAKAVSVRYHSYQYIQKSNLMFNLRSKKWHRFIDVYFLFFFQIFWTKVVFFCIIIDFVSNKTKVLKPINSGTQALGDDCNGKVSSTRVRKCLSTSKSSLMTH